MIFRSTVVFTAFLAKFAMAEQPELLDPIRLGLPATHSPESQGVRGGFIIDELGSGTSMRTQSRAVELLGSEFSRAAAQGLVETQEAPQVPLRNVVSAEGGEQPNLSVVTGLDRDISVLTNIPPTDSGAFCLSDERVDIGNWGDPENRATLGKLRTSAIAENGNVIPEGAADLARYYIALGFGSEAVALTPYIADADTKAIITAMAEVLDKGESNNSIIKGQIFCNGSVALWAALAAPISAGQVPRNTDQILTAFSGLPFHLRTHLGPLLAERFREAGLEDKARNALNAVTRGGTLTDDSKLVSATLGLTGTRPDLSRKELLELSRGTDLTAAKALLELLKDAVRREVAPDPAWVDDVSSLVRATEGTKISTELYLAGLRGLISLARFDDLRLALNADEPDIPDTSKQQLAALALAVATKSAPDVVFLRSALGFTKFASPKNLNRADRLAFAARLYSLGLADVALTFLPEQPSTVEERRTASRVIAATGDTSTAVQLLEPTSSELHSELGTLLAQQGETARALASFEKSGESTKATRLAIQAGNWEWISGNGLPAVSEATQALRSNLKIDGTAQNGVLLTHTQERRQQAERLLGLLDTGELSDPSTN